MASAAAVTGAVSAGSRTPASARAISRAAAWAASQGLRGGRGGEVVEDELGGGGAQPVPVAGAAGELGGLDAGFLQHQGGVGPGGGGGGRRGPAGVGGVRALVGQDSPGGGVAVAVGGAGGVGGGGVDAEVACRRSRCGPGRGGSIRGRRGRRRGRR